MRVFFVFVVLVVRVLSLEYGLDVKHEGITPIARVQFFAERCSGSNYVEALLLQNTHLYQDLAYGWKHFPVWVGFSEGTSDFHTLAHSENCLFVVVFRDPYDWLRSFHLQPHHSAGSLRKLNFSKFIRASWVMDPKDPCALAERAKYPLTDKDPLTGKDFKNPMKLRTAKIQTMLRMKDKVHHIYYIHYEVARRYPKQMLEEIAKIFSLPLKENFVDIKEYKGDKSLGLYVPKKYDPISFVDLSYINFELNRDLEERIGYPLKSPVPF